MHVKLGNLGSSLSMSNTLIMHKLFIYARLRAMDWRTQKAQFRNHSSLLPRRQADRGAGTPPSEHGSLGIRRGSLLVRSEGTSVLSPAPPMETKL